MGQDPDTGMQARRSSDAQRPLSEREYQYRQDEGLCEAQDEAAVQTDYICSMDQLVKGHMVATMESAVRSCKAQHIASASWSSQESKLVVRGTAPQDQATTEESTTGSSNALPALSKAAMQNHQTLSLKASEALRVKVITGQDRDQKKAVPIAAESATSCVTLIQLGTATQHK